MFGSILGFPYFPANPGGERSLRWLGDWAKEQHDRLGQVLSSLKFSSNEDFDWDAWRESCLRMLTVLDRL